MYQNIFGDFATRVVQNVVCVRNEPHFFHSRSIFESIQLKSSRDEPCRRRQKFEFFNDQEGGTFLVGVFVLLPALKIHYDYCAIAKSTAKRRKILSASIASQICSHDKNMEDL